eukprot:1160200-Pelagomonas_calceolata.AAC.8
MKPTTGMHQLTADHCHPPAQHHVALTLKWPGGAAEMGVSGAQPVGACHWLAPSAKAMLR